MKGPRILLCVSLLKTGDLCVYLQSDINNSHAISYVQSKPVFFFFWVLVLVSLEWLLRAVDISEDPKTL